MKRLDLVVGPNGSGKSTFITRVLLRELPSEVAFVNADEIAKRRWPGEEEAHAYDASRVASQTRTTLIGLGRSLVAETVFSHPSKLDLITDAQQSGYVIALHVLLVPENLTVLRVAARVQAGGHSVPEQKIRERYGRLWPLVAQAVHRCEMSTVYDNSGSYGPEMCAQFVGGIPTEPPRFPVWAPGALIALT